MVMPNQFRTRAYGRVRFTSRTREYLPQSVTRASSPRSVHPVRSRHGAMDRPYPGNACGTRGYHRITYVLAGTILAAMMQADIENIRITAESIDEATFNTIGQTIASARRLCIMGLRSGVGLAHHAAHYFTLARQDVQVLHMGGANYAHELSSLRENDVLLVIAFRRRPRRLPLVLNEARAAGATTILITDLSAAASAKAADHVLRCRSFSPSPFNSFAAAVTLINYLAWLVTGILGEASLAHFQRIDRLVNVLDDVSTPQTDKKQ